MVSGVTGPGPGALGRGLLGTAAVTTRAVLGAGTLLVPAALAQVPGSSDGSLVLGGALLVWCLLVIGAGGNAGGPVTFVARSLGPRPARVVQGLYFVGFALGQAAVATAAGEFAADGTAATVLATTVLFTAAAAASSGVRLPGWALHLRLAAVVALTAAWWCGRVSLGGDTGFPAFVPVLVPLLFAWVGLETSALLTVTEPHVRRSASAAVLRTAVCLAVPAVLYAALLTRTPPTGTELPAAGWAAAALLAVYCLTNLRACGARWLALRTAVVPRSSERRGVVVAAVLALAALFAARAAGAGVGVLLLGPGAATASIYLIMAAAAVRRSGRPPLRWTVPPARRNPADACPAPVLRP